MDNLPARNSLPAVAALALATLAVRVGVEAATHGAYDADANGVCLNDWPCADGFDHNADGCVDTREGAATYLVEYLEAHPRIATTWIPTSPVAPARVPEPNAAFARVLAAADQLVTDPSRPVTEAIEVLSAENHRISANATTSLVAQLQNVDAWDAGDRPSCSVDDLASADAWLESSTCSSNMISWRPEALDSEKKCAAGWHYTAYRKVRPEEVRLDQPETYGCECEQAATCGLPRESTYSTSTDYEIAMCWLDSPYWSGWVRCPNDEEERAIAEGQAVHACEKLATGWTEAFGGTVIALHTTVSDPSLIAWYGDTYTLRYNSTTKAEATFPTTSYDDCGCETWSTCRHPRNGDEKGFAGLGTTWKAALDELAGEGIESIHVTDHGCFSTEDASVMDPEERFYALNSRLEDEQGLLVGVDHAQIIRRALATQMKLIAEMHWGDLGDDAKSLASLLYAHPGYGSPSCGVRAVPLGNCDIREYLPSDLAQICGRVLSQHVDPAFLDAKAPGCLGKVEQLLSGDLPSECGYEYLVATGGMAHELFVRQSSRIEREEIGALTQLDEKNHVYLANPAGGILWRTLHYLDVWYRAVKAYAPYEEATAALDRGLYAFWNAIYGDYGALSTAEILVRDLSDEGLKVDRALIRTLFSEPPPMTGRAMLATLAGSLQGLNERIQQNVPLVDLACRFVGCRSQPSVNAPPELVANETTSLIGVLASLSDREELAAAVGRAASSGILRDDYVALFSEVGGRWDVMDGALDSVGASGDDFGALSGDPLLARLRHVVESSRTCVRSYRDFGFLGIPGAPKLYAGVHGAAREEALSAFAAGLTELRIAIAAYDEERSALLNVSLQNLDSEDRDALRNDSLTALRRSMAFRMEDLATLRRLESADEAESGLLGTRLLKLAEQFDGNEDHWDREVVTAGDAWLKLSAADAKFTDARPSVERHLESVAADGTVVDVVENEIVVFEVSGQWEPSCALRSTSLPMPGADSPVFVDVPSGALTGPEGYSVAVTTDGYQGRSTTSSLELAGSICAGAAVSGGVGTPVWGTNAYVNAQACISKSESNSDTKTTSKRTNASFVAGFRSPMTPLYAEGVPVGALAAVAVDSAGEVKDAVAVGRSSMLEVPDGAVRLFLVVNDLLDGVHCPAPNRTDRLTVKMTRLRPVAAQSSHLVESMRLAETALGYRLDGYTGSESMSHTDLQALRAQLWENFVANAPSGDISSYPEAYGAFFEQWLETSLSRAQRRVRMHDLERQIFSVQREIETAAESMERAAEQSYLRMMQPIWAARRLSGNALEFGLRSSIALAMNHVYPVIALRYREALSAVNELSWGETPGAQGHECWKSILGSDFTLPLVDRARIVYECLDRLGGAVRQASIGELTKYKTVAVGFPRTSCTPVSDAPCERGLRDVDALRTVGLWEDIAAEREVVLTVVPGDLYASGSTTAALGCRAKAPVVEAMAAVLALDANEYVVANWDQGLTATAASSYDMVFPQPDGPAVFSFAHDSAYPQLDCAIALTHIDGKAHVAATQRFEEHLVSKRQIGLPYREGAGLSPVSHFTLSFSDFFAGNFSKEEREQILESAVGLYLVFALEYAQGAADERLAWIRACDESP